MDIISLGKANHAKRAVQKVNTRLGDGVQDIYPNVKTRLEELEKKDPHVTLYNRVSDVEANTAANINKHNLRMNAVVNKNRYGMTDLAFDDFGDDTGIDKAKSTGFLFDAAGKKVKIDPGQTQAEVVTTAETTSSDPTMIVVSQASNAKTQDDKIINLQQGNHQQTIAIKNPGSIGMEWEQSADTTQWIVISSDSYTIKIAEKEPGIYYSTGTWESPVIDLGDNYKSIYKIIYTSSDPTKATVYVSTSMDNQSFLPFSPVNSDGTISSPHGRFLKIKIELQADGMINPKTMYDFDSNEKNLFQSDEQVIFNGSLKLKTNYTQSFNVDPAWVETGTLLRTVINKNQFKSIEKLEVV
jgi:hypothetical protein